MNGIDLIRSQPKGTIARIAKEAGIRASAVSMWTRIPVNRLAAVERVTGISRNRLRPDIFAYEEQEEEVSL
jgi:DNA-binding transcriptional regulator YdaS (Cro superfamily)